jgi:hypothetical protein
LFTYNSIELFANPCSEEHNYREKVLSCFPNLKVLDRNVITDVERSEAKKKLLEVKDAENGGHTQTKPMVEFSTLGSTTHQRVPAKQRTQLAFSMSLPTDETWKPLPKV